MTDQTADRWGAMKMWCTRTRKRFTGQPDDNDFYSEESENTSGVTEERQAKDDFPYKGEIYMWINILFVIILSVVVLL